MTPNRRAHLITNLQRPQTGGRKSLWLRIRADPAGAYVWLVSKIRLPMRVILLSDSKQLAWCGISTKQNKEHLVCGSALLSGFKNDLTF